MKLLLTSAGLSNQIIKNEFVGLFDKKPKDVTVAFIPTAAYPKPDKKHIKIAIDQLHGLGLQVKQVELKEETEKSLEKILSGCDVVYVNGGNTFYLLDWVRKSGFDKIVKKLVMKGIIYLGVSAGSILAGPDIGISRDENVVGITNLDGLNLVNFVISPHFIKERKEILLHKANTYKHKIVPLTNNQAILVDGNLTKLIGEGDKVI